MSNLQFRRCVVLYVAKLFSFGAVIILLLYIKSCQGEGGCQIGFYQHWEPEENKLICCRAVSVKQGYEGVHCNENGTEDTIRKCPPGTVQPDKNSSEHALKCMVELECLEGTKTKLKCDDGYCWNICVCDLESGKCGTQVLHCKDIREIDCSGKIEEDCSCSPPDTTSTTSPSILVSTVVMETYTTEIQTNIFVTTPLVGKTRVTDHTNNGDKNTEDIGSIVSEVIYIGSAILAVFIIVIAIVCAKKHEQRRLGRLIRATENEHQPLLNHNNGDIHIQMGNLSLNQHIGSTPVPAELQEMDLDNQIGSVDSSPESLEEPGETENGDDHQPLHSNSGDIYLQLESLSIYPTPVPSELQESDLGDQNGSVDSNPESLEGPGKSERGETSVSTERVARVLPIVRPPQNNPSSYQIISEDPVGPHVAPSNYNTADTGYMPPTFPSLGPSLGIDSLQSDGQDQVEVPREANTGSHSRETLPQN